MSAEQVDVVQVLDDVIARLLYSDKVLASKVNAALLAVSELIAAVDEDRAADAEFTKARRLTKDDFDRAERAEYRLTAALARVKGEAS